MSKPKILGFLFVLLINKLFLCSGKRKSISNNHSFLLYFLIRLLSNALCLREISLRVGRVDMPLVEKSFVYESDRSIYQKNPQMVFHEECTALLVYAVDGQRHHRGGRLRHVLDPEPHTEHL